MQIIQRNQEDETTEIDLLGLLYLFWKKKWTILACGILGGGLFLLAVFTLVTPQYTASITLYANNSNSTDKATSITSSDISASVQLVDTYAAIILSDPVLDEVIERADLDMLSTDLEKKIDISAVNDTEVFQVDVADASAEKAAEIANYIAEIGPEKIGSIVDGCSVKVVNYAKTPYTISSPSYVKFTLIGGVLAAFLCCLVIFLHELLDTSIKSESDLATWNDLPVLGVIPEVNTAAKLNSYNYNYGGYGGYEGAASKKK